MRHGFYHGEEKLELCQPDSNNLDRLFHYRIKLSHLINFKVCMSADSQFLFLRVALLSDMANGGKLERGH